MAADLGIFVAEKLIETIGSDIIKYVCDMWDYKSHLEDLKQTVSTVRKVLLDAEAKQAELYRETQDYIEELKDAVYDADDLFDEVLTLAELKQLRPHTKSGKLFSKVSRFFSPQNQLGQTYRMSRDVKEIKKRLDVIADRHNRFGLNVDYKPIVRRREETCSYVDANKIIGRDKEKETIINMLLDHTANEEFCCVTIVGVGGLGKTALAQLVYNDEDVKKMFPVRLWVCVSDQEGVQFDVKTILCKILEQVMNKTFDHSSTLQLVQNQFQEQLRGKKYLIVLDDVWNEDREEWLKLEDLLKLGQSGSKIMVTTRSEDTGKITSGNNFYRLEALSPENAWHLFELSAFGGLKGENHDELVEIGHEIVKKCYNIPLAIKVIGSVLFGQDISKWRSIKESGLANIGKGDNKILSILKLSYHNLAPSLKSCFCYCALFPKDYRLKKEMLINLWRAQGYITPLDGGKSIEDAAEEHFVILLRRCFFQDVEKDSYGYIESVKIHDLMHDVAQEVGKKEIQVVTSITDKLGDRIRHVCYSNKDCVRTSLLNVKMRSLLRLCSWSREKILVIRDICNLKSLRVLHLQGLKLVNLPDSIGELIHLRYLDLSGNDRLEVLPEIITRLHNLQTLLLYWCSKLRELPKDFWKLDKLRHLDLTYCSSLRELPKEFFKLDKLRHLGLRGCRELRCMPSGMEKLMGLKVLPRFVVGKKDSREAQRDDELKPLKALTGIRGEITIEIGGYYRNQVEGMDDMGGGYLKGMKHLAKVEIEFEDKQGGWDNPECERVLEKLEVPLNVKVLTIKNYDGTVKIPSIGPLLLETMLKKANTRAKSRVFIIDNMSYLKSLPINGLTWLFISNCGKVKSEERVPEAFQRCASSLQTLSLLGMKNIRRLCGGSGLEHYTALESLQFWYVIPRLSIKDEEDDDEDGDNSLLWKSIPQNLRTLEVFYLEVTSLPKGMHYLTSLQNLHLYRCEKLEGVPDWIDRLSSLQSLSIILCPAIKSLPQSIHNLTSLQRLDIYECPDLKQRCEKPSGEDYPKIRHIPNIIID